MRKLALGIGAAALLSTAAFANEHEQASTQVAAIDTSSSTFSKLDADHDGRISAIEAANDSQLSAAFSQGDTDKDGYLSRDEFKGLGSAEPSSSMPESSSSPSTSTPPADPSSTTPQK